MWNNNFDLQINMLLCIICGVECENQELDKKYEYCVFISETWYKLPISMKVIF